MEKKEEPEEPQVEVDMTSNWDQTVETFDELNLKPLLLRGIYGYGFEKPSPIQQKAILPIIQGRDVIAQAQVIFFIIYYNNYNNYNSLVLEKLLLLP